MMLAARKYDFESDTPFNTTDILDLQSVVKHLSPVCVDARDLLESGKLRLAQVRNFYPSPKIIEMFSFLFCCVNVCSPVHLIFLDLLFVTLPPCPQNTSTSTSPVECTWSQQSEECEYIVALMLSLFLEVVRDSRPYTPRQDRVALVVFLTLKWIA